MSDFSLPITTSLYTDVLQNLKDRDVDAITLCVSVPSNIPTGAIRYLRASDKFQEWSGAAWVDKVLSLAGGGTGAASAAAARTNLGLGTLAVQDASAVAITGGSLAGATLRGQDITSGTINTARMGSGAGGTGTLFLADDNTWKPGVPVGSGKLWFTNTPPSGYLICDGSAIDRTTYAGLFAVIGTTFGAGNGTTTFNLPDLRQRFPLGKAASGTGNTLAATGGAIDHTHTSAAHTHTYTDVPNHTHPVNITDPGHVHAIQFSGAAAGSDVSGFNTTSPTGTDNSLSNTTGITATSSNPSGGVATGTTASTTPGATGSNNPPYLVVNYIIKY